MALATSDGLRISSGNRGNHGLQEQSDREIPCPDNQSHTKRFLADSSSSQEVERIGLFRSLIHGPLIEFFESAKNIGLSISAVAGVGFLIVLMQIGIKGIADALPVVLDHPPSTLQLTTPPFLVLGGARCKSTLDTLIRLENVSDLKYLQG